MKVYLAGPMRGIPEFNYPAFRAAAARLRAAGHEVFSPAEYDERTYGRDISNATGDAEQAAKEHGFNLREALAEDLRWICTEADAVVCLSGWTNSKGAKAERATAEALGLIAADLADFLQESL